MLLQDSKFILLVNANKCVQLTLSKFPGIVYLIETVRVTRFVAARCTYTITSVDNALLTRKCTPSSS